MSKKKIFVLICLVIVISWSIVTLYYYNMHVVTVKEHWVGEKIETSEGIVFIHGIEIRDYESTVNFDSHPWFHESVLPKVPRKLQRPLMRALPFYTKDYTTDLSLGKNEGRIMLINGFYVSKPEEGSDEKDQNFFEVDVISEHGRNFTFGSSGRQDDNKSNIKLFHSSDRFYLNEYTPDSSENLIIRIIDRLNGDIHEIIINPTWQKEKYNFFNPPPSKDIKSPEDIADRFIRAVVYDKDLSVAKELIHSQIDELLWENLKLNKQSKINDTISEYLGSYLGFDDVFLTKRVYIHENDDTVFEQKIYMVIDNGEWRVIDVDFRRTK